MLLREQLGDLNWNGRQIIGLGTVFAREIISQIVFARRQADIAQVIVNQSSVRARVSDAQKDERLGLDGLRFEDCARQRDFEAAFHADGRNCGRRSAKREVRPAGVRGFARRYPGSEKR